MFQHILLPTDGSPLSDAAIQKGIQFASSIHARVTGLYVMPPQHPVLYEIEIPANVQEEVEEQYKEQGRSFLSRIETQAREAGVRCEVLFKTHEEPFEMIIQVAAQQGCDLIMMASHGRRGVKGLLLGSETQKVLTHSKVPVLVLR